MRRTKILATLGPASSSIGGIRGLLAAGADGFRVNFSHGSVSENRAVLRRVRATTSRAGREVALVADLQGPKMRLGPLVDERVRLVEGRSWVLDRRKVPGDTSRAPVEVPDLARAGAPGDPVLLGDGEVELAIESADPYRIQTRVVHGGWVRAHTGLFLPRARPRASILGPKDLEDLRLALAERVDFVALSFVRSETDVERARRAIRSLGGSDVGIIAKIERSEALGRIPEIVRAADALMVARGDLGVEVPLERLALEQKRLVALTNAEGKPAIVATQMLLSMLHSPRPTRAEATDVANAVIDGADAVMLSEESAVGPYSREAVSWLARITEATERAAADGEVTLHPTLAARRDGPEWAVASAAVHLAAEMGARAIVTPTHSGRTAALVAAQRPTCPVLALSSQPSTRRKLALQWGVVSRPCPKHLSLLDLRELASRSSRVMATRAGQPAVLTAGFPVEGRPTNLVTLVDGN